MSGKKRRKKLRGTVTKVVPGFDRTQLEKAQIEIDEADPLYREVRVDNEVTDEEGEKARLKPGAEVDVVIEATDDATIAPPPEKKQRE